jgi:hypothetical protein
MSREGGRPAIGGAAVHAAGARYSESAPVRIR